MPWCFPCDRYFATYNGYDQHIQNSAAHQEEDEQWECKICDRCFATERSLHQHYANAAGHSYCNDCERIFMNDHNLMQHMRSRTHQGGNMQCPFCKNSYTNASGLTIHLESGTCSSGLDRHKINNIVRRMDRNNVIINPNRMITMPGQDQLFATERAWNGYFYECYLCDREFNSLPALNQHLKSPAHEQHIYRCPKVSCGRQYKLLSRLVQHVESESCGVMRFARVQAQAKGGLQNMVGRMISQ